MYLEMINLGQVVVNNNTETSLPTAAGVRIDKDGRLPSWFSIRQYATVTLAPNHFDLWPEFQADPSQTGTHPTDGWLAALPQFGAAIAGWVVGTGKLHVTDLIASTYRFAWPPMRPLGPWMRLKYQGDGCDAANYFTVNYELLLMFE